MAKRKAKRSTLATSAAVSVGTALGKIANRVDSWLAQRDDIAQDLNDVIGRAQTMLSSLGTGSAGVRKQVAGAAKAVKKGRRKMSKEAREKIAAAQRARWAKKAKAAKA